MSAVQFGEMKVRTSGLSIPDQRQALQLIAGLTREYPNISQSAINTMIDKSIEYVRNEAEKRLERNQLNLFTETMLLDARPGINRERGLAALENLGLALQDAENHSGRGLAEGDDYLPWDIADSCMENVCRNPDAVAIAKEWGFAPTGYGYPLLTERGTAIQSSELLEKITQERDKTRTVELGYSR